MDNKKKKSNHWLKFLGFLIKSNKLWFYVSSAVILLLTGILLIQARVIQELVDATTQFNFSVMLKMLVILAGIVVANIILNYLKTMATTKFGAYSVLSLKTSISHKILYSRYKDINKLSTGDVLKTVNGDVEVVCSFVSNDLTNLLSQFIMLFASIAYLIYINPLIGIVTFVYTPIGMCFTYYINNKMDKLYPKLANGDGSALSMLEQIIMQIPVIKSFGMQKRRLSKVYKEYDNIHDVGMTLSNYNGVLQTACSAVSSIPRITFYIIACYLIVKGQITLGTMIALNQLLGYIIGPTVFFPFLLNGLNAAKASMNRINDLINSMTISNNENNIVYDHSESPLVQLKDVAFAYEDKNILEDYNFNQSEYGITVISGQSGSGKTTILDIISGIQMPTSGKVMIHGKVFAVTQENFIFTGTVIDNVRIARENATDDEVIEALKRAKADEFCNGLPNGYETMIGDGYVDFSGGQKQRISLARMFLSDANIILLDEPTSSLDADTENIIIEEIIKLSKSKIVIISAHREALFNIADRRIAI